MITATYARAYKKNQKDIFVYALTGDAKELAAYKTKQGEYYKENEEGQALFFTTNYSGKSCVLAARSSDGSFYVQTDIQAVAEKKAELTLAAVAKMEAIMQFTGKTKDQIEAAMIAAMIA